MLQNKYSAHLEKLTFPCLPDSTVEWVIQLSSIAFISAGCRPIVICWGSSLATSVRPNRNRKISLPVPAVMGLPADVTKGTRKVSLSRGVNSLNAVRADICPQNNFYVRLFAWPEEPCKPTRCELYFIRFLVKIGTCRRIFAKINSHCSIMRALHPK